MKTTKVRVVVTCMLKDIGVDLGGFGSSRECDAINFYCACGAFHRTDALEVIVDGRAVFNGADQLVRKARAKR